MIINRTLLGALMLALSFLFMGTTCNPESAPTKSGPYQGDRLLRDYERTVTKYSNTIDRLERWAQLNAGFVAQHENVKQFIVDVVDNRDEHVVAAAAARDAYVAAKGAVGSVATLEDKLELLENLLAQAEGIMMTANPPPPETSAIWNLNPGYI